MKKYNEMYISFCVSDFLTIERLLNYYGVYKRRNSSYSPSGGLLIGLNKKCFSGINTEYVNSYSHVASSKKIDNTYFNQAYKSTYEKTMIHIDFYDKSKYSLFLNIRRFISEIKKNTK